MLVLLSSSFLWYVFLSTFACTEQIIQNFTHINLIFLSCFYVKNNTDTSEGAFPEHVWHATFSFCFICWQVQLANINISVKSLRRAVLVIMKKYMRTSEILCSFVARYIFGHFFQCYLRPMNNLGLETDGNTKSTEKKFFYIYYKRYTKLPSLAFFLLAT